MKRQRGQSACCATLAMERCGLNGTPPLKTSGKSIVLRSHRVRFSSVAVEDMALFSRSEVTRFRPLHRPAGHRLLALCSSKALPRYL